MTDVELKQAIEAAFHKEVRLRGSKIRVDVQAGHVTLGGEVEQLAEKRLATNLVRRLREVGDVTDGLVLQGPRALSDAEICRHIFNGVAEDANLHEQQMRVAARDGRVTLTGWTNSLEEKCLMGLVAWWVPGVLDVDNRIEVIPRQQGTAGDLLDVIRLAFEKDMLIDPGPIAIRVEGPLVTLVGNVRSQEERLAAEHDCYYIWGVEAVCNQLVVVPA